MKLQDVILKAMAKKISRLEAGEIAGVKDRTMRWIRERYTKIGYTGLFDQRRGKRSIHRLPMQTAEEVLRFSTVPMADLIVVLDGAPLVEVGTHDELMARNGLYSELYRIQAAAYR